MQATPSINPTIFRTDTLATGQFSETSGNLITPTSTFYQNPPQINPVQYHIIPVFILFPLIIVVMLLVQTVLFVCCIFQLVEKRKYKKIKQNLDPNFIYLNPQCNIIKPPQSQVWPDEMYGKKNTIQLDPEHPYNSLTYSTVNETVHVYDSVSQYS